jgi:hypothetical protein
MMVPIRLDRGPLSGESSEGRVSARDKLHAFAPRSRTLGKWRFMSCGHQLLSVSKVGRHVLVLAHITVMPPRLLSNLHFCLFPCLLRLFPSVTTFAGH